MSNINSKKEIYWKDIKKILFLTWKDKKHPHAWWAEKVMYEYMKILVEKWYEVTWFAHSFKWCKKEEIIDWIKVIRKFWLISSYFFFPSYYKKNLKWKFDLIIDEAGWFPFLTPLYVKDTPIVLFTHHIGDKEWDFKFPKPFSNIFKAIYKEMFYFYKDNITISVSQSTKEELIEIWLKEENIYVIENTLNDKKIKKITEIKENKVLVLWRLMPIKRVEDSIKAFYEFYKDNKNYTLTIVWNQQDKNYFSTLLNLVENLWIEHNVEFLGFIPDWKFEEIISMHKLLLINSYKEWFWLVVLECNCYWIPTLWYNVPWLKDSIKEWVNWYLIEDWNYIEMWNKMNTLLNNKKEYDKLSISSINHIKNIPNWDNQVNKFLEIIKNNI